MKKKPQDKKVIYAEVRPDVIASLDKLCKKLDLPRTKVIAKAIKHLELFEFSCTVKK